MLDRSFGGWAWWRRLRGGHWELRRFQTNHGMSAFWAWERAVYCTGSGWTGSNPYYIVRCEER